MHSNVLGTPHETYLYDDRQSPFLNLNISQMLLILINFPSKAKLAYWHIMILLAVKRMLPPTFEPRRWGGPLLKDVRYKIRLLGQWSKILVMWVNKR